MRTNIQGVAFVSQLKLGGTERISLFASQREHD
jgi:hypothetical protein